MDGSTGAWIDQSSFEKEGKEDETEKMKRRLEKEGKDCRRDSAHVQQLMWETCRGVGGPFAKPTFPQSVTSVSI